MLKALVPLDGSEHALTAIHYVIRLFQESNEFELHLVNVQPPLRGNMIAFATQHAVDHFHRETGHEAMKAACELLDRAGIGYKAHIVLGKPAVAIAHLADEFNCDQLIMGTHGYGTVKQLLHGSVTHEVIHLIRPRIPVTLVKAGYVARP
jgi:nucleotide-binding universal stress UspA family protein